MLLFNKKGGQAQAWDVIQLMDCDNSKCEIKHVYRESNRCDDKFANLGHSKDFGLVELNTPTYSLKFLPTNNIYKSYFNKFS